MPKSFRKIKGERFGDEPESHVFKPSVEFTLEDLPEGKDWDVGSDYTLAIKAKLTSIVENERRSRVGFEVVAVKVLPNERTTRYAEKEEEEKA